VLLTAAGLTRSLDCHVAESDPSAEQPPETTPAAAPRRSRRRFPNWPWLILLAAALLGIVVGTTLGLRSTSLFTGQPAQAVARPTIVIGAAPSPSPIAGTIRGSPSPAGSPIAQVPGPSDQGTQDYEVEAGDTMRSIAQKVYGDPEEWRRIYDANRDVVGSNPDNVQVGMHLKIPQS